MDRAIHPVEKRSFTYREYMHLMGMPHDFQLLDPKKDLNKIAQNVPSCTARDWTLEVVKFVKGELKISDTDYLRQNNITQTNEISKLKKASQVF
jgi:site-specific DNA-cytosine methylase